MYFRGTGGLGRCFEGGFGLLGGYMHSGWGLLMMGGALLVTVLIVVAIIALVRKSHRSYYVEKSDDLAVLNERFVKGEITEEEYTRMKKILRS